ncbi:GNAT family N-acetyltransferase [Cellulomonas denverensis]|uniref:GNAT family N-acetyltransferase n=1 Tax=Cellulomonas denverensis TaxID=264297 RepID=A0A7X6KTK9_9CELL|nr:GNAT family N-acetyltransferase [Cellulomonas denverensis]NKY21855.1 GNAT family N-acetyltransferase [Cellulomonas denverensis]GIG24256.1 hypothetical protein Cde04nite_05000 [Cellulomonas denverensis]
MTADPRTAARDELDRTATNTGFAQAVLAGTAPGELWWDRDEEPRAFHVVHPCGMSLLWGPAVADALDAVTAHLLGADRPQWLQIDPRWHHLDWDAALGVVVPAEGDPDPLPAAVSRHTRINFSYRPGGDRVERTVPAGWQLRPAAAGDYGLAGTVVPAEYWPDAASFLAHGGGMVAERDGEAGAMAFAAFCWDDQVEIGIETVPRFRRLGLARAAAGALIDVLVAGGLRPVWSCRGANTGSQRLAGSLGFTAPVGTPYLHLPGRLA